MKRKKIYILTDNFPYGEGEKSFLIPELEYLKKRYELSIISCAPMRAGENIDMEAKPDADIRVYHYKGDAVKGLEIIRYMPDFFRSKETWKEIRQIVKSRRHILRRIKSCMFFYARAVKLYKWMRKRRLFMEEVIYYSYWYNSHVLSLLMEQHLKIKLLARAHGYDLYAEQTDSGWQPYKRFMDERVDRICFISEHGYKYYLKRYAVDVSASNKYHLCRLGTGRQEACINDTREKGFLLVSCAGLISLKRIEMIIEGLAEVQDAYIRWVHFGAGDRGDALMQLAHTKLSGKKNIAYTFKGLVPNEEVLAYYQEEKPDCFITTSSNEGSPVSIQEAIAFAMPVIGTAVGGIPELIDGNGVLLPKNPTAVEVGKAILRIYHADTDRYVQMRKRSLEIWQKDYDRDRNVERFMEVIDEL